MSQPRLHLTVHSPFSYYGWHFIKEMIICNWPFCLLKNMNLEKLFCSYRLYQDSSDLLELKALKITN